MSGWPLWSSSYFPNATGAIGSTISFTSQAGSASMAEKDAINPVPCAHQQLVVLAVFDFCTVCTGTSRFWQTSTCCNCCNCCTCSAQLPPFLLPSAWIHVPQCASCKLMPTATSHTTRVALKLLLCGSDSTFAIIRMCQWLQRLGTGDLPAMSLQAVHRVAWSWLEPLCFLE